MTEPSTKKEADPGGSASCAGEALKRAAGLPSGLGGQRLASSRSTSA
jgi:hypothetical protein